MDLLVLKAIKHNGHRYKPGQDILGVEKVQAKRLIMLGAAEELRANAPIISVSGGDVQNVIEVDQANSNTLTIPSQNALNQQDELVPGFDDDLGAPDDLLSDDEVFKLIWDNFKHQVLKEDAASELGLDFAGNITKTDLINLILEEEKEDYFLDQIKE